MAVAVDTKPWTERRRRVAELRARQGFARQLLDFYGALLGVQERAYLNAASSRPSADKLASYVADMVVPAVVDVSLFAGPDQLRGQLTDRLETEQPARILRRWIAGEPQPMIDRYLAPAPGLHTRFDRFLSGNPFVGIAQIAALYVGLLVFSFLLEYLQTYYMQWAGQMVMFDLRSQIIHSNTYGYDRWKRSAITRGSVVGT